ncbi:MAG: 3-phosphoshikimate 1-carboxyvinyltransferase [Anaerolineae bacterium]|nr:3-phosphoshikimate 1-carboxyvinyltransferase [Anaerolineae bacterium]MDW8099874.1 3-phosphoshikimate 1-carboxyvinyltransferase [Anaerolineae bacterium]
MVQLRVRPGDPLRGRTRVPGDKSISNRFLILAALAEGESHACGWLASEDTLATLRCMAMLGAEIERSEEAEVIVWGRGLRSLREPSDVLYCESSGTTIRLLAGLLAGQPFTSVLTGSEQLRRRPMGRVAQPLRQMGATILGRDGGNLPPLAIHGGNLSGIEYALPVASAQVKSALLLAGLFADGLMVIREPAPSRDHTERLLQAMGVPLTYEASTIRLMPPTSSLAPLTLDIPGDFSSAAFLIGAALLVPGSEVVLEGVGVNPTRTGLWEALLAMGAGLERLDERVSGGEPLADLRVSAVEGMKGTTIAGALVPRMIDEFPLLAVLATQAEGETVVRDAAELRVKESDRVATVVEELRKMGAQIEPRTDGFTVMGRTPLRGAPVDAHGDHRLAMALAVAGLVAAGETVIEGAECIGKSFPEFPELLADLGADIEYG